MLAGAQHRHGAAQRRVRVLQLGGVVDGAAVLARVAVLVLGAAARAFALDEAVRAGTWTSPGRRTARSSSRRSARSCAAPGRSPWPAHGSPAESVELQLSNAMWKPSRYFARPAAISATKACGVLPCFSAAIMIGAPWASSAPTKCTVGAVHALEPHPDVRLDVLHHVPDVERRIGVGQGGGDEEFAGHGGSRSTPAARGARRAGVVTPAPGPAAGPGVRGAEPVDSKGAAPALGRGTGRMRATAFGGVRRRRGVGWPAPARQPHDVRLRTTSA